MSQPAKDTNVPSGPALGSDDEGALALYRAGLEQVQQGDAAALLLAVADRVRSIEREIRTQRQDAAWNAFLNWATDGKGLPEQAVADAAAELDALDAKR